MCAIHPRAAHYRDYPTKKEPRKRGALTHTLRRGLVQQVPHAFLRMRL